MGDPVTREVMKFYEEQDGRFFKQQTFESYALNKYLLSQQKLERDKQLEDTIKLEMYMEAYAEHGFKSKFQNENKFTEMIKMQQYKNVYDSEVKREEKSSFDTMFELRK